MLCICVFTLHYTQLISVGFFKMNGCTEKLSTGELPLGTHATSSSRKDYSIHCCIRDHYSKRGVQMLNLYIIFLISSLML